MAVLLINSNSLKTAIWQPNYKFIVYSTNNMELNKACTETYQFTLGENQ